jgi:ABC-2 type transport system ATP-binding protein
MTEVQRSDRLAIATHALSIQYGKATAVHRVDLRVAEGAVYVLAGANGAGKSSVMKVLMNLVPPSEGRAEVFGLNSVTSGPMVRAQIGYMPDSHDPSYSWMTGARLMAHVAAFFPTWDHSYASRLCERFGVLVDRKTGTLSKGEMRRLQFVLALAHRPPLLLLDEPTDGLDPMVRSRTLAALAEHLADTETTVMISTHHIHEVESFADHIGVLNGGRLTAQMSRDELQRTVRQYRLEVPDGWQMPGGFSVATLRRSKTGRELQCTLLADESEAVARLKSAGATVRDVKSLSLEEGALALLSEEITR